jgi:FkbM family methyltransferase
LFTRLLREFTHALRRGKLSQASADPEAALSAAVVATPAALAAIKAETPAELFPRLPVAAPDEPAPGAHAGYAVLSCCDPHYFRNFALPFAKSLATNGAVDAVLHLQVIAPDPWIADEVSVLRRETPGLQIRYEAVGIADSLTRDLGALRTALACSRFIALPDVLRRYRLPVLVLDIDVLIEGALLEPVRAHATADVLTTGNAPEKEQPWLRFVPSPLLVRPTTAGIAFAETISRYANHFMARGIAPWGLDRIALAAAYAELESSGAALASCDATAWPIGTSLDHDQAAMRSQQFRKYLPRLRRAFGWTLPGTDVFFPYQLACSKILCDRPAWEAPLLEACVRFFGRHRRALDVGAHVGFWSWWLSRHFARVDAFEPQPVLQECLRANVDAANVTLHGVALGEHEGATSAEFDPANTGMSHLVEGTAGSIPVRRLDEFGFDDVDFVKLDAEGYELFVLKGGVETLRRNHPVVLVEQAEWNARYGVEYLAAVTFLESLGARLLARLSNYDFLLGWDSDVPAQS